MTPVRASSKRRPRIACFITVGFLATWWIGFGIALVCAFHPRGMLIAPGKTVDARRLIRVNGRSGPETRGALLLTTVSLTPADAQDALRIWLDRAVRLVPEWHGFEDAFDSAAGRKIASDPVHAAGAAASRYLGARDPSVEIDIGTISGPSSGLMLALGVVDLAGERDLADGRRIAGTGAISPDGMVGPVGGIRFKVAAAERADAEVFLAPLSQLENAQRFATRLRVIGVRTLGEALRVLGT